MQNRLLVLSIFTFITCQTASEAPNPASTLVDTYCTACHLKPEANMLPKAIWRDAVLPMMGAYLGMKTSLVELQHYRSLQNVDLVPASPLLTEAEWFQIKEYLLTHAPDTLMVKKTYPMVRDSQQIFRKKDLNLPNSSSTTSMVSFSTQDRMIRYGSGQTNRLYQLNLDNNDLDSLDIGGAPAHIIERDTDLFVLSMGLIHPNDHRDGQLLRLKTNL